MTRIAHMAVVVPAADEEDTIVECLRAVVAAGERVTQLRPDVVVDVVVVLDACRDRTAELVAGFTDVHAVSCVSRSVGAARQLGTTHALARALVPAGKVWTAHTDADSAVPVDWLVTHLDLAERGAAVVLGTVVPLLPEPALSRWRSHHDDTDGHPHVHGANLGIRGEVITGLGGWPQLAHDEDVALLALATNAAVTIERVGGVGVRTSARAIGRAPDGFSRYLVDESLVG